MEQSIRHENLVIKWYLEIKLLGWQICN